ncbi:MAG: hypothetical protein EKK46_11455 [Rhodocyclaceae bacterium]|nr:MAG: hypothetical protein EKK46_11455 [Rhodocyclaceae bacterium]
MKGLKINGYSPAKASFPRKRESSGFFTMDSRFRGNDGLRGLVPLLPFLLGRQATGQRYNVTVPIAPQSNPAALFVSLLHLFRRFSTKGKP